MLFKKSFKWLEKNLIVLNSFTEKTEGNELIWTFKLVKVCKKDIVIKNIFSRIC